MKKIKGFTLIEVIVSVVVIAIISAAGFEFLRYCRHFIVDSELRVGAANFAHETMEKRGWNIEYTWNDDLEQTKNWQDDKSLPAGAEFASKMHDEYGATREYRVRADTENADDSVYNIINVRVNWNY